MSASYPNPRISDQVLLIEDDAGVADALVQQLRMEGFLVDVAHRGDTGLAQAKERQFDVVITDLKLPGLTGLELLSELHCAKPGLPIILMTAYGTTETAIEATKLGAFDYLIKPFEVPELLALVDKAASSGKTALSAPGIMPATRSQSALVGQGRAMQAVYKEIGRLATTAVNVLIRGETGTGKEIVARAIYEHSARANGPFVAVNCTAIPETLVESELFGHERGAFTGAHLRRIGRFEQAQRGTIFLDEIGDLDMSTQVKLLRVLQEKYVQRVGGNERIPVDVRVLAATHRDLERAMAAGQFREDLFYRLSTLTIDLPPLRERLEDIPDLVSCFLNRSSVEMGVVGPSIQSEAIEFLRSQSWPGNVRELENVVRQALLLSRDHPVALGHVHQAYARTARKDSASEPRWSEYLQGLLIRAARGETDRVYSKALCEMERCLFTLAIRLAAGNQAKAARWLGVTRTTMREKLTQLGLHAPPQITSEFDPQTAFGGDRGSLSKAEFSNDSRFADPDMGSHGTPGAIDLYPNPPTRPHR